MATNASLNAIRNEIKGKIPCITNLAITNALNTAENKIPDHSKQIPTPKFNKFTAKGLLQD